MAGFDPKNLYSRHREIEAFFNRHVSNREDREDLVQEVLYLSVKNIASLRNPESVGSWIYGICRNILKRYYSQRFRNRRYVVDEIATQDRSEDKVAINLLLSELPDQLRVLYELFFVDRYKISDISRILSRPEGTVKYQLFDLRAKMRKKMTDMDGLADIT